MINDILNAILEWIVGLIRDTTWDIVSAFLAEQMLRFPDWLTDQAAIINGRMTLLAMAAYGVVVVIGGFMVMSNESIQTTYSAREIVPRLIAGFLLAALSWTLIENMQQINNEIVTAMTTGDNSESDPEFDTENADFWTFFQLADGTMSMPVIELLVAILMLVAIIMLFLTMLTRNVVWFLVASFAPIALVCHSLPITEGAAMLWWRLMFACMASSIGQASLIWTWQTLFQGIDDTEVIASYSYKPFFVLALVWAIWKVHKTAFIWARGTPLRIPGGRLVKGLVKTAVIGAILKSNPLGAAVGVAAKRLPFLKGLAGKLNPAKPKPRRTGASTGPGRAGVPPRRPSARPGFGRRPKDSSHRPKNRDGKAPNNQRGPNQDQRRRTNRPGSPSNAARNASRDGKGGSNRQRTGKQAGGAASPTRARGNGAPDSRQPRSTPKRPPKPGWTPAGGPSTSQPPRRSPVTQSGSPQPTSGAKRRSPKPKWRPEDPSGSGTAPPPGSGKRRWKQYPPPNRGGKWRKS
jgi:hypothetical protein